MFFASNLVSIPPMGVRYFWLDPKVTKRSRLTLLAYSVHCVRCARLKPFAPLTSTALRTLSPFSPFYGHQRMPGFSSVLPSLLLPHRLPLRLAFLLLCLRFLVLLEVCRSNNTYYNGFSVSEHFHAIIIAFKWCLNRRRFFDRFDLFPKR